MIPFSFLGYWIPLLTASFTFFLCLIIPFNKRRKRPRGAFQTGGKADNDISGKSLLGA